MLESVCFGKPGHAIVNHGGMRWQPMWRADDPLFVD
jgi:hypothetical protein